MSPSWCPSGAGFTKFAQQTNPDGNGVVTRCLCKQWCRVCVKHVMSRLSGHSLSLPLIICLPTFFLTCFPTLITSDIKMEFTELYKQSLNLCRFSPNGLYLANVVQFRVVVRDAESLQILHLFTCTDNVQEVLWSPDSELVLCASFKLGSIQIWSLKDEKWTAKIDEGAAGCTAIKWAPDARHLLSFADFQVCSGVLDSVCRIESYVDYFCDCVANS